MDHRVDSHIVDIPVDKIQQHAVAILDPAHIAAKFH